MASDFEGWMQELQSFLAYPIVEVQNCGTHLQRPYMTFSFLQEQGVPKGSSCEDEKGVFWQDGRKVSLQVCADSSEESFAIASKAQGWFLSEGRRCAEKWGFCVGEISALQLRATLFGSVHEFRAAFELAYVFVRQLQAETTEEWIETIEF